MTAGATSTPPEPVADAATARAAELERLRTQMPPAMVALPQWLLWRFEQYDGDKKPRKVPYYASGRKRKGEQGSAEDRAALVAHASALQALESGRFDGLGFAFLPGDGLVGIDIDGAIDPDTGEVSPRCQAIIDACASYTEFSPSGKGVHIIVQGQTETFKDNSIGVEVFCGRQFFTCTGRRWPGTADDAQPLQDAVLGRLKATVRGAKAKKPGPGSAAAAGAHGAGNGGDLLQRLESALQALSADMPHDDWVAVGMACKAALGDAGFRLWDYWSSKGAKYPGGDQLARKWASFGGSGVTEATIFKWAMDAGWKAPKSARPAPVARKGASTPSSGSARGGAGGRDGGDAPPGAQPMDGGKDPDAWRDQLIRSGGGKKDCRENVYLCLVHHPALQGLVGYDEFSHRVMKRNTPPWDSAPGEWTTNDDYFLGLWLAQHERLQVKGEGTLVAGVAMAAYHAKYHPVMQYLNDLPQWDQVPRMAHWLHECLGAQDSEYTQMVGTWFLMGMVRRVTQPGCQMDYMVVLEGLQGKGKSTALRTLVGNDEWFADTPMRLGDKDAMLSLAGKWLYEVGELDAFNKAEVTAVKQYVSSRHDRVREPFARRHADRPRSGVFAGTTNQSEYFKDPTGARRFWPVACDADVRLDLLTAWRDQLFAEAKHRLAHADPEMRRCWPTREEEEKHLVPQQERREIVDPWYERIAQWVESTQKFGDSMQEVCEVNSFTSQEVLTKCLNVPMDRIDGARQMATRVGIAMHKLGWEKHRDATGARLHRYWRPGTHGGAKAGGPAGADAAGVEGLHEF